MLLLVAAAWACPALPPALDAADAALGAADSAAVAAAYAAAAESLGCALPAPEDLGRFWLVESRKLTSEGDAVRAQRSADAARRLLDPDLPALARLPDPGPGGRGWLLVDAAPPLTRVDTQTPAAWPLEVPAGLHLVQVVDPADGAVRYGKVVRVGDEEEVLVESGVPAPPPEVVTPSTPLAEVGAAPARPRRSPWWFVASGVAAGGAAGLYWLADHERAAIDEAATLPALDAAFTRQRVYAGGAVLLTAGSAFGVVGYFVF